MEDNQLSVIGQVTGGLVPYTTQQVFQSVDALVQKAVDDGDPEIAFNAGRTLQEANRLSGLGLARLLYGLKVNWPVFNIDVPFEDVAYQHLELDKANINRYVRVIEMLESGELPEEVKAKLEKRPIRDLIPIATTFASGYAMEDQWDKLVEASNNNEVQEQLRDIKGTPPRSNSLIIRIQRDGTLRAYPGGEFVGYLAFEEMKEKPLVEKAIRRIINSCGILEE